MRGSDDPESDHEQRDLTLYTTTEEIERSSRRHIQRAGITKNKRRKAKKSRRLMIRYSRKRNRQ